MSKIGQLSFAAALTEKSRFQVRFCSNLFEHRSESGLREQHRVVANQGADFGYRVVAAVVE